MLPHEAVSDQPRLAVFGEVREPRAGPACMQADALEHALVAALPLGPQSPAGGVSLPSSFHGELQVPYLAALRPCPRPDD